MHRIFLAVVVIISMFTFSCTNEKNEQIDNKTNTDSLGSVGVKKKISDEVVKDLIKSLPSPLELSVLIKSTQVPYSAIMMNNYKRFSTYETSDKRALNIGVYGTDLGYAIMYENTEDAVHYVSSLRNLSTELGLEKFYETEHVKKLASGPNNIDSLLFFTTSNFEMINDYLHEKNRSEQSILIITGGWVEAMYISTQLLKKYPNQEIKERIAEQKITYERIMLLLDNYKNDPGISDLTKEFNVLDSVFNKVSITYTLKEQKIREDDGVLYIDSQQESQVNFDADFIAEVTNEIEKIRTLVVE
jgi:hypothetical protein